MTPKTRSETELNVLKCEVFCFSDENLQGDQNIEKACGVRKRVKLD